MLNTLNTFLNLKDEEVFPMFQELQGYTVVSGDKYLFLIPTTNSVTPVLLCANTYTARKDITISSYKPLPEDIDSDCQTVISNFMDSLGGDSRASCSMAYYMAKNFVSKPFILLTNDAHLDSSGLREFAESKLFDDVKHVIYQIISMTTEGSYRAQYGDKSSNKMVELLMYDLDLAVSYSKGYWNILQEYYSIPHIDLSYGGYNIGKDIEVIYKEEYLKSSHLAIQIVGSIRKEHSSIDSIKEVCIEVEEPSHSVMIYTCEVCDNQAKAAKYYNTFGATLCHSCVSRINSRHRKVKCSGAELINLEKIDRAKDNFTSWIGNYKSLLSSVIKDGMVCPVCQGTNVIKSKKLGGHICIDCKIKYLEECKDDGTSFLFTGNIIKTKNHFIIYQGDDVFTLTYDSKSGYKVIDRELFGFHNDYFKLCGKCGMIHTAGFTETKEVWVSNGTTKELTFCKACMKTL